MQLLEVENREDSKKKEEAKENYEVKNEKNELPIDNLLNKKIDDDRNICKFCGTESFLFEISSMLRLDGDWRCKSCQKYQGEYN